MITNAGLGEGMNPIVSCPSASKERVRERNRRFHENHPDVLVSRREQYLQRKIDAINKMGGKCHRCGIRFIGSNLVIFDFHHTRPELKAKQRLSTLFVSGSKDLQDELEKCVLVCANCHRLIHKNDRKPGRPKIGGDAE